MNNLSEEHVSLEHDMEINMEGLYAIAHLQEKIESLKEEVRSLSRKLDRHQ